MFDASFVMVPVIISISFSFHTLPFIFSFINFIPQHCLRFGLPFGVSLYLSLLSDSKF